MKRVITILILAAHSAWGGLVFESTEVEVLAAANAETASTDFNFTNQGDQAVSISHINPDCDCLAVKVKGGTTLKDKTIRFAPGESGVIRSTFKIGNSKGTIEQVAAIWMVGDPKKKPSIRLTSKIKVPELVSISHKTIKWAVGSDPEPQRILVTMSGEQAIAVTSIQSSSTSFEAKLETIEAGRRYAVVVTPQDTSTPGIAVIQIRTDCKVEKQRRQQAFAMIHRPE